MIPGYAAIILAAGLSSRMPHFKPLLSIGEETITDHVISTFVENRVEVILVVGWRKDELTGGIKNRNVKIVENPDYRQGMFSSIKAGLQHLNEGIKAFFVMPVDIPLVKSSTIKRLITLAKENPRKILYPVYGKLRGHPPLVPVDLVSAITHWDKNGGLNDVLSFYDKIAMEVPVRDRNIHLDMDTPEDYRVLLKQFESRNINR
jgi:molybdenum cofactor cytidylyltransferase